LWNYLIYSLDVLHSVFFSGVVMSSSPGSRRFLETTRGQLVTLLRRGPLSVDELARAVGLTDNAVRAHLATLERDGMIRQSGTRRGAGVGKPATLYELHPDGEAFLSRAYAPVLGALVEEIVAQLPVEQSAAILDGLGRRLAAGAPSLAGSSRDARLEAGATMLRALGGVAEIEERGAGRVIRGYGCPLAATVARRPETCRAVESLLREIVGPELFQCCHHGERPSCCFEVPPAA
jgi:predicted ArsR family transcriptional regulator